MPKLSAAERQLLLVIGRVQRRGSTSDRETLERIARTEIGTLLDWTEAFETLVEKGLVIQDGPQYLATEQGDARREQVQREYPYWTYMYDEYFSQTQDSAAHAAFCRRVYGRDLCQHGLMDGAQLEKLLSALALDEGQRVLELGCGNGLIAEYIADVTGAHVTGVDVSSVGIRQAQERTRHKQQRLKFQNGNADRMDFAPNVFDTLICIDTLYFLDLENTIARLKGVLRPGGQMGLFYTQWLGVDDPPEQLQPAATRLAQALQTHGLSFRTWDFSTAEDAHWQKKVKVLAALKPAFEAEGNIWLYEFRLGEALNHVGAEVSARRSRHLYHVQLP